jgi:hypothetical protein
MVWVPVNDTPSVGGDDDNGNLDGTSTTCVVMPVII